VEAVIQLPTDEFFNTGIYTYLWVLNKRKSPDRKDRVMLINASGKFKPLKKNKGSKRKEIDEASRLEIVETLARFVDNDYARVFEKEFFYFNKQAIMLTNVDEQVRTFASLLKDGKTSLKLSPVNASGKFWATEHAVVVYLKRFVHMNWYGEILRVMNLNQYSVSAAQPGLAVDRIKKLLLSIPPLPEQKEIAHYLDTKTAQIDRKIDLLTQKATQYGNLKQSLINETVTRGLDKSVSMKDGGIEWIGEVPEHWEVKRVKEIFDISRGRVIAQTELIEDGYYPVYSSQTKDDGCLGYINTFDYEGEYITGTTDGANAGTVFLREGQFNCTNICGTLKLKQKNQLINYAFYSEVLNDK
jgi:restriction endonuclease S subunit